MIKARFKGTVFGIKRGEYVNIEVGIEYVAAIFGFKAMSKWAST